MADTAARLAISARRNEVARFTIAVTGIDMTGVAMAMQVRQTIDNPYLLFALGTVNTLAAEGLKLDSVTVTNGVPTSIIKGRINASTMTDPSKVPYMGEIGAYSPLAYAMQWTLNGDAQTRLYGDFVVLGSAFGSDNAPTNRPPSYGVTSTGGGSGSGSLAFGDQIIRVSVGGTELLAPYLAAAAASAIRAENARDVTFGLRNQAANSAGAAALSATRTTLDVIRADAAAATAEAAQQAVLDNIAGIDVSVGLQLQAVSVAALRAITERPVGRQAFLSETGRGGTVVWSTADLSAVCAIDTAMGIYIPPAGQNGSAGAWVRVVDPGRRLHASWFGLPNAISADDSAVMRAIEALRPSGTDVKFAPGSHKVGNVKITKPGHWGGSGKLTVMQHIGGPNVDTFGICTTGGTRFSHMRFTGLVTPDNANARFPLYVSPRERETDNPGLMEDFEFNHLWFDGCSTGIRVSYGAAIINGEAQWFTPERTSIHHCVFQCTYQDVIPESRDVHIYKNSFLRPDTADNARPFAHCMRILGCNRVTIEDNYIATTDNHQPVSFMLAGVDIPGVVPLTSGYRTANDVTYRNNRMMGGLGIFIRTPSGVTRITGNKHWRDPSKSDLQLWIGIFDSTPTFFGTVIVEDNHVVGFTTLMLVSNAGAHHIRLSNNLFVGNAYIGGVFDASSLRIELSGNDHAGNPLMAPKLVEVVGNRFVQSLSASIPLVFAGGTLDQWAQTRIEVRGNTFPYSVPASGNPADLLMQRGGGTGDPLVYFGQGVGYARYSAIDPTTIRFSAGDNIRFDADAFAQFRTNMDRPEMVVGVFPPVWP